MTRERVRLTGPCLIGFVTVGVATAVAGIAWAQGPKPPEPPAQPKPPTPPAAGAAASEAAVPPPATALLRQASFPPEVIKAAVAPVLGRKAVKLAAPAAKFRAEQAQDPNEEALIQASQQLDKFQKVFEQATKIFGGEHTVITPSFFYATDINGRLSTTDKHMAGLSAVLLLPLFGAGGGHGSDWWPVVTTDDATQIYSDFLDQLKQYEEANRNATTVREDVRAVLNAKWDAQRLAAAVQIFCRNDIDWPSDFKGKKEDLCGDSPTDENIAALVTTSPKSEILPRRHTILLGPSLGIPLTKNPIDLFQFGGALELGWKPVRFVLTGGLVGRYQGSTYGDIFASGWYVGLALSGEIGDKLFHYFNGGSELMAQLARVKTLQQ